MFAQGRSFSGHERNCCYLNMGAGADGRFANISAASGIDFPDDGRAIALVDWDQDGDLDLWVSNRNAPRLRFLRNEASNAGRSLMIRLQGNGTSTSRDAIGARVELVLAEPADQPAASGSVSSPEPPALIKTLRGGEGFLAQNSKWLHFGLGQGRPGKVVVHWPGGRREQFNVHEADQRVHLVQGSSVAAAAPPPARSLALVSQPQEVPGGTAKATIRMVAPIEIPALRLQTLDRQPQTLQSGEGSPLLINLWASWCKPCAKELKEITEAQERIRQAGARVFALSVDGLGDKGGDPALAADFLKSISFPFESGLANTQVLNFLQAMHDLQMRAPRPLPLPSSFLINAQGQVAVIYRGPVAVEVVLEDIERLGGTAAQRFERSSDVSI